MDLPFDVVDEISGELMDYHNISWEDATKGSDILYNRKLLEKMGFTNYIDYVYHQMGFEEIFDLPDIMLDKIIEKIPLEGISKYLKLSENRINKYAKYLNGHLLGFNKSLTRKLYNEFKDKIDGGSYLSHTNIDFKTAQHFLDKTLELVKKAEKEEKTMNAEKDIDRMYKDAYKYAFILQNPKIIPILPELKIPKLSILYEYHLALNPAINDNIHNSSVPATYSASYIHGFSKNPFLPLDMIEKYIKYSEDTKYLSGNITNVLKFHVMDKQFMKKYGELYNKFPFMKLENPCIKVTKEMISEIEEKMEDSGFSNACAFQFYEANPLCRIPILNSMGYEMVKSPTSAYTVSDFKNRAIGTRDYGPPRVGYYTRITKKILEVEIDDYDLKWIL